MEWIVGIVVALLMALCVVATAQQGRRRDSAEFGIDPHRQSFRSGTRRSYDMGGFTG